MPTSQMVFNEINSIDDMEHVMGVLAAVVAEEMTIADGAKESGAQGGEEAHVPVGLRCTRGTRWRRLSVTKPPAAQRFTPSATASQTTSRRGSADSRANATRKSFAATVEVSKMRGEYVAPSQGKVTVGELGPGWLERQRGHMKPSGFRSYESASRVHVAPRWARTAIADLRFSDVQAWVAELSAKRGPVIVATAYSVLARILDDAVRDRSLVINPARGVKLPKRPPRRNVYLTVGQQSEPARRRSRPVQVPGAAARRRRSEVG